MKFLHQGKKSVVKFMTPSGVTAYVAPQIPKAALEAWSEQLTRKIVLAKARLERLTCSSTG